MVTHPRTVHIFDTTLRDGEQAPGFSMTVSDKIRLALQLEALGVDVIEAGFPAASPGDAAAVRAIASAVTHPTVAALARARQPDLDVALQALAPARRPRLHVFLATSDLHLREKLRLSRAQALECISWAVRYASERIGEVEFSAEDATRSDPEFLLQALETAAAAGARILNLPDTVGYATPDEYRALFQRARQHLAAWSVQLSAHCHDDLGLAVANSLAAIAGGADQVECTINGIGERAGNASLEEIALALAVRSAYFGVQTGIELSQIYATSRLLVELTGVPVPPNKAVVGANAFAHEAGIHQDGVLKNPLTYELIAPERLGIPCRRLVIGKHSGRRALAARLAELGCRLEGAALDAVYADVMALADRKKMVSDAELLTIAQQHQKHSLEHLQPQSPQWKA